MSIVFVGGSRHISHLPADVKQRLNSLVSGDHDFIVGDANGADKAVQKCLLEAVHERVTVFYSGDRFRNNLGSWRTHRVKPPRHVKDFQFYAAKDREMAREANVGLMIWDGKSTGTILNVLRLIRAGKSAVLINVSEKMSLDIESLEHWEAFLATCSPGLRSDLEERATQEEWASPNAKVQLSLLASLENSPLRPDAQAVVDSSDSTAPSQDEVAVAINAALESGDPACIVDVVGTMARLHGMTQVARDTGLANESLYRSLSNGGNPEFATVLKVLAAMGVRLQARPAPPVDAKPALQSA